MFDFFHIRKVPKVSCVYCIKNNINNKIYIGSAQNLKNRIIGHKYHLFNNKHYNCKLQRFVNKYGLECLQIDIVEICDKTILLDKEQYYINTLSPWYNIDKFVASRYGHKCSNKTKKLISLANSGINNGNSKLNPTQIIKIRKSNDTCKNLSILYNISAGQICLIKNYKSYKNV